jgi:site-specific DNA recombinase
MLRVAIYCRVSSAEQERRGTIEAQLRTLRAHATAAGYTIAGEYLDDGKSAATGKLDARDGLARLMVDADARRFGLVLVVDVDRLTRTDDVIERAAILGPFQRLGIHIATPTGILDLNTFVGDMMIGLQAAMAAQERRKILERTRRGKESVLARGGKPHGCTPFGLRYDKHAGWSLDERETAVIREIAERVAAGEACGRIAADLTARGVPSNRRPWSANAVWHLMRYARERYAGRWVANARLGLSVPVPRILSDEAIDRVDLAMLDTRRRGLEQRTRGVYLLGGSLAACGRCGAVVAVRSPRGPGLPATYVCRNRTIKAIGVAGRCDLPVYRVDDADRRLWAELVDIITAPDLVERARRAVRDRGTDRDQHAVTEAVDRARAEVARLDRVGKVLATHGVDALDPDALAERLTAVGRARRQAAEDLRRAEQAMSSSHIAPAATGRLEAVLAELRARVAGADPEERRRVTRSIVTRATVTDRGLAVGLALPLVGALVQASSWSPRNESPGIIRIYVPTRKAAHG